MGVGGVPTETGQHLLGPHVVGHRIVVRRVLPGETGPSGGPAMTDVLGVCLSWGEQVVVQREDGETVVIDRDLIVSGKPVPPRPSRFARVPPASLTEVFDHRWIVDPDGPQQAMVIGLAKLTRATRDAHLSDDSTMRHQDALTYDWLLGNEPAQARFDQVLEALTLPDQTYLVIEEDGQEGEQEGAQDTRHQVARGRVNLVGEWAHFADLTVQDTHKRLGLATVVLGELADWAASRGATAMALNVNLDNEPALNLYAGLGFEAHHRGRKVRDKQPTGSA